MASVCIFMTEQPEAQPKAVLEKPGIEIFIEEKLWF